MEKTATQRQNQFNSVFGLRSADQSWPNLLQGVAGATQQLLTSSDYATGVNLALATLGQVTGADRVYIFEFHPHPETGEDAASQRFEWARETVTAEIDNPSMQNLTCPAHGNSECYEAFSAGSSFSALVRDLSPAMQEILEPQGIRSILLVPIPLNGKLWGFIGFDDCHSYRVWSRDEEAVLMTMAATLGSAIAQRQASEALRQTESRLQKIAANVPGMIYQFLQRPDGSRSVLYASSGCRELLELEPSSVEAVFHTELIYPDDREAYEQSVALSAATLQPWHWEGRIVTHSGFLKWIQCASRPERQPNGDILWDGVVMDITQRKQAEEELRQSEGRYKAILDAIPDMMFRLSRDGVYLDFKGDGLEAIVSKEAIVGKNVWELLPSDVAQMSLDAIGKVLDSETLQTLEYQLATPLGMRDYEARLVVSGKDEVLTIVRDITERKRAEAALRESEEKFALAFRSSPDAMSISTLKEGRYVEVNDTLLRIAGFERDEVIGHTVSELNIWANPEDRDKFVQLLQQNGAVRNQEFEFRMKSGEVRLCMLSAEAIELNGELCLLAVNQDITERKQREVALRESEEKFSKAFRSSPDFITISTLHEGRYIEVNDSFLLHMGFERDEAIGHTILELNTWVNPQERTRVVHLLQEQEAVRNQEVELRTKTGEVLVVLLSAEIIELAGEQCMLCVTNDITERKRAEMQLAISARRDRLLAEIGCRIRCSLNLEQILNTTVTEVRQFLQCDRVFMSRVNENLHGEIFAESVSPNWEPIMGLLIDDKTILSQSRNMFGPSGVIAIDDVRFANISPLRPEYFAKYHVQATLAVPIMQGDSIIGALVAHQCSAPRQWQPMEIELLKQLATQVAIAIQQAELYQQVQALNANLECQVQERTQQLEQRNQELLELNQLKDVFLHAVTHDLRTPVVGWLMVLKNLLNHPSEPVPVSRSILERMILSSDRQLYLINSLLDVHAKEVQGVVLKREPVQPSQLIRAIIQDLEPLFAKNQATLRNLVPEDLPVISADPAQLWRVFENLITNAFKHNPPGLCLTLRATPEMGLIRFEVEDNGVGISQEACATLFELYVRGARARRSPGLGLGLYLCRQIVNAHGGEIGVISRPGAGAKFWFTLPLVS